VNSGQKRKLLKSPECKSILNTVKIFRANSVFQGKVKNISIRYMQPVKAIIVKFLVRENTTRKELHHFKQGNCRICL